MTSTHSRVSLKGADSKPMFLPGELERRKPKSMCTCMAKSAAARLARDRCEIGAVGPRRERRCGLASSSWEELGGSLRRARLVSRGHGGAARARGRASGLWRARWVADADRRTPWHCEPMRRREGAVGVEQDVAVVPVLDLEEVAHDRVRGGALHEVAPRAVEGARVHAAVAPPEEVREAAPVRHAPLDRVERHGVGHHLDQPRGGRGREDAVRPQAQRQPPVAEDPVHGGPRSP